ncbi:MAG: Hint domain-containing protein [Roseovarius sp.]|uniref:Hint domain-containing protein n=1 Tax=Roseovarius sp. TaxID=1486281 RepID=UPI004059DD6F
MFPFSRHVCSRRLTETGCARCGASGLVEGTALRVRGGWRRVEQIDRHDPLHVFPKGRMKPDELSRERIWLDPVDCPSVVRPLEVPPHALGNREAFLLQQNVRVLMHDPELRQHLGTGHVTIRAGDLAGFRGIALTDPPRGAHLFRPVFCSEQFVLAAGGAWLLCPPLTQTASLLVEDNGLRSVIGGRMIRHLDAEEADAFLAAQESRDHEAAPVPAHR